VCETAFTPVAGIGGRGHATGRLHTPQGLAVNARGWVWVADTGNARVQVIDTSPRSGAVVLAVLSDGLREPVHVAVDPCGSVYVADRATGCIHVFGAGHAPLRVLPLRSLDPWSGEPWSAPPVPRPLGVALTEQGTLAVFDPGRAFLWHMRCDGTPLPALPWPGEAQLPAGWQPLPHRHAAEGELVLGPLDSGTHNFAWHELQIDATLPPGTRVLAQTFAHNDPAAGAIAWAPHQPVALAAGAGQGERQSAARLVLGNDDAWQRWQAGRLSRALEVSLHRFEGSGPVGGSQIDLPATVARRLRVGDRVALRTLAGGRQELRLTSASAAHVQAAVSGEAGAFAAPSRVQLIQRRDQPLPYGPLDLTFLGNAAALVLAAPTVRDARPEPLALPHDLAAFLQEGDVLELSAPAGRARVELAEHDVAPVSFGLDAPVVGDFSRATLSLVDSDARLVLASPLGHGGALPPGSMASLMDDAHSEQQPVSYVECNAPAPGLSIVWLGAGALGGQVSAASWNQLQFPEARATDRGRYLWLRLRLLGALPSSTEVVGPATLATATPAVHALRITGPRPSLLALLPALYSRRDVQQDSPNASFLERFLTLFEGRLTDIEAAYESIGRLLNPAAADAQWLEFVAGWLGLSFDPSWPPQRRRQLVIEGATLQAGRGTPAALARYLEIYTGSPVGVSEDFERRAGAPIQLGARGALGMAPLGGKRQRALAQAGSLAHRFSVSLTLPSEVEPAAAESAVRQIIETMKPAHTVYRLRTSGTDAPRIGLDTVVGAIVIAPDLPCCDDREAPCTAGGDDTPALRLGGRLGRAALTAPIASRGVRHA
jgi:phage tail-like protein